VVNWRDYRRKLEALCISWQYRNRIEILDDTRTEAG